MRRAAIVIVSYRTPSLTAQAVRSSDEAGAAQIIIVDSASGDETVSVLLAQNNPRVKVIENDANVGFGAAANVGAQQATSDYLVFLNSDAELSGSACDQLLAELELWSGRAIVAPRLIGLGGEVQRSAGLQPTPTDLAVRALGLHVVGRWASKIPLLGRLVMRSRIATEYASAETATQVIDTTSVSGACFAIGREAFLELGGFDERFFMYFEDADLCLRALQRGWPIRFVPGAEVAHVGGASSAEDYHFGPLHARSMRQYLEKWYGPGGRTFALVLLWLRALGMSVGLRPGAGRAWRALRAAW